MDLPRGLSMGCWRLVRLLGFEINGGRSAVWCFSNTDRQISHLGRLKNRITANGRKWRILDLMHTPAHRTSHDNLSFGGWAILNKHRLSIIFPGIFLGNRAAYEETCLGLSAISKTFSSRPTCHSQNGTPTSPFGPYHSSRESTQIAASYLRVMRLVPSYFASSLPTTSQSFFDVHFLLPVLSPKFPHSFTLVSFLSFMNRASQRYHCLRCK